MLEHLGIPDAPPVGEGTEAVVYDAGDGTVVKVYRGACTDVRAALERRRAFAVRLAAYRLPFGVPVILRTGQFGSLLFTVEHTLPGQPLASVLPGLPAPARQAALRALLAGTAPLGQIELPGESFGELLAPVPIRTATWPAFLHRKIATALHAAAPHLVTDVGATRVRAVERYLEREIPAVGDVTTGRLVHGDYFAENVFVTPTGGAAGAASGWAVSGVTDFSELTLVGDPRLDVASAVLFVEELRDHRPDDTRVLSAAAVARYGPAIEGIIYLYRLYYSVLFAVDRHVTGTYRWCVENIRRHAADAARTESSSLPSSY